MRKLIYLLILFPVVVFAQKQPGMPPHMHMDMMKMEEAMACMKNIDQSALEGLREEGEKMKAEISALCKSGEREEAQDKAMAYGKEIASRPELLEMRKCGKMMESMMSGLPFQHIEKETKNSHICDDF